MKASKLAKNLIANAEITTIVGRWITMRLNILTNDFVSNISRTHGKVAACPHVPSPILAAQIRELFHQQPTAATFEPLSQFTHRKLRRNRNQHMHMVSRNMSCHDEHIQCLTTLSDQLTGFDRNLPLQHRFTLFCNPDKMVFQVIHGVGALSVTHPFDFTPTSPSVNYVEAHAPTDLHRALRATSTAS